MKRFLVAAVLVAVSSSFAADASETQRQFLSGHGPKDAVPWEFSVTGGRRAGEQTTIPVPSQWEQHGFGVYNYGQEQNKGSEHGLYRTKFTVPADWRGRRIRLVFDGVMTDAAVKVNGTSAGPVHQGGFTRFRYEITRLVKLGAENVLEVDVSKVSANPDTERAERGGDYWVFGGIYRPVWLEALPATYIEHVAIDARADGTLNADVVLTALATGRNDGLTLPPERIEAQVFGADGQPAGAAFSTAVPAGGIGRLRISTRINSPKLWTAESPNLYTLRLTRRRGDEALHTIAQRFGFRTFEVRDGEGLFLNGQRILLKGVDRHSFRPETGRALTREDCYEDVRLMRSMNMNAVRMSHYPPDEAFLEACDEIGLYVLDELSGWQHAHDTVVGRLLVRELVERDVNHPSILFWDNGNEGGFNRDLDNEFALHDPQQRRVLHPWDTFGGVDTRHYTSFDDHAKRLRGPNLVMPTEILHALYDGGGGAGLEDYWHAIEQSKFGAGMFIWDLQDEGIIRTDLNGKIDVHSTFAPDGVVGPHFEKEGSYYTIRDVWSPVQIERPVLDEKFDGALTVHNRYDFTSLAQCRFEWKLLRFAGGAELSAPAAFAGGKAATPNVAPHGSGKLALNLPPNWREADVLALTVFAPTGDELWTSTWPTASFAARRAQAIATLSLPRRPADFAPDQSPRVENAGGEIHLRVGDLVAKFDATTGNLRTVQRGAASFPLSDGPRLAFARPPTNVVPNWLPWQENEASALTRHLATPGLANVLEIEVDGLRGGPAFGAFKLEISPDGSQWKTLFDASRRQGDGARYEFPPQHVAAVRISNLRRYDAQPAALKTFRIGYAGARFPAPVTTPASVTSGTDRENGSAVAWVEARGGASGLERARWTLRADGALRLDYGYAVEGDFAYHGITFDLPEEQMKSLRWLGEGPYRVWQNRLRGTWLGVHETKRHELQPGESWEYPEFEGYFAGVRAAELETAAGKVGVAIADPTAFLRVGTPRISHVSTTIDFPAGDLSFLHAIPAIGSKGKPAPDAGPASQWAKASGRYSGSVVFRF